MEALDEFNYDHKKFTEPIVKATKRQNGKETTWYRERKIAVHTTKNGVGVVGRLVKGHRQ